MKFSIIVPTFNNLNYLKFFLSSLKKNSSYDHQIILHINDGSDGTLNFAKENKLLFTYSENNNLFYFAKFKVPSEPSLICSII